MRRLLYVCVSSDKYTYWLQILGTCTCIHIGYCIFFNIIINIVIVKHFFWKSNRFWCCKNVIEWPEFHFQPVLAWLLRAPSTTAIFNRNRNFQRQPRPNFLCMGSSNRNHHRNLQVAVAVAVDKNFLIFGGRSLKSRLRLGWGMGRSDEICHISADICMLLN